MKTIFNISAVAVFLVIAPSPCFALWQIAPVSKEGAKELGMEVRSTAAGPNHVTVELEFKTEGTFQEFSPEGKYKHGSRVELRIGEKDKLRIFENDNPLTAALREERSKPGCVIVSFTADGGQLDNINLWVMVPEPDGGTAYVLPIKDFLEIKKDR